MRHSEPVMGLPHNGAFVGTAISKNSANAAYGATIHNADMVNPESRWLKLLEFRQKLLDSGRFPDSKTTVKYNRRFFVNGATVHFAGERHPLRNFLSRNINDLMGHWNLF